MARDEQRSRSSGAQQHDVAGPPGREPYGLEYYERSLGEPYRWDNPVWLRFFDSVADYIVSEFDPKTVLDAGCGMGFLVGALRERGVDARGFDVSTFAIDQVPATLRPCCVLGSVRDEIDGKFDLICCIEVLEHVESGDADVAIANFARHTDTVLFSSTPDDRDEPTHINIRSPADWVRAFGEHGFVPLPSVDTVVLSAQAVVFERCDVAGLDELAAYEDVRYQLTLELQRERESRRRRDEELQTARERAGEAERSAVRSAAAMQEAERSAVRSAAAMQEAERSRARSAAAAEEANAETARVRAELETVLTTTWWRVGRPVRGATTAVRLRKLATRRRQATGASTARSPMVKLLRPFVPLRIRRALRREYPDAFHRVADSSHESRPVRDLVEEALPLLRPLRLFPAPGSGRRRLTLVTDSLNADSLFGGVGTSIILAAMLADRLGASLRVATRRARPDPTNFGTVLEAQEVEWNQNVDFVFAPLDGAVSLPLQAGDLFLTTSWWSTWSALRALNPENIVYLLQEDERLFYPAGDEQVACTEVLADPRLRFLVNTAMLQEHLVLDGFANIGERGLSFEPAFPEAIYFHDPRGTTGRREFFFYARPNNVRNLFLRGIDAIDEAIGSGVFAPDEWTFRFVGSGIPAVALRRGVTPVVAENLPWPDYAALIRRVDVGLSLMSTPHPSYPPLDLVACGAVAVTNRFGIKEQLDCYSANIICTDLSRDAIVAGIAEAAALAGDSERRLANYRAQGLSRSWAASLGPALDELTSSL